MGKFQNLLKNKPLIIALIVAVAVVGLFSGLKFYQKQKKQDVMVRTGIQSLVTLRKDQRLSVVKNNANVATSLIHSRSSKASDDDPTLAEVCEFMGDVTTYWYNVMQGTVPNSLGEVLEPLAQAIEDEDWETAAEMLSVFDIDMGMGTSSPFDQDFNGELDQAEILAAWETISTATPQDFFEASLDMLEEICPQEYIDWTSGMGWGSGSGMGSGSY